MSCLTRHTGDARDLSFLPASSVDLVVTSPPYWQRRDYGHSGQLGQEATPEAYVDALIEALNGWARLLRPHASVFLNLGGPGALSRVGQLAAELRSTISRRRLRLRG